MVAQDSNAKRDIRHLYHIQYKEIMMMMTTVIKHVKTTKNTGFWIKYTVSYKVRTLHFLKKMQFQSMYPYPT